MQVTFKNVKNDKIKKLFTEVLKEYDSLYEHEVVLGRKKLTSSTMQAQPIITLKNLFSSHKRYRINLGYHIRDKEELIIANVPDKVLKGWFAHELGHIVDYRQYTNLHMVLYGLRYVLFSSFRKKVEHDADYIAIKYGFYDEILATKEYILDHDLISESYKKKIKKYYLSIEQVQMCSKDESPLEPYLHL